MLQLKNIVKDYQAGDTKVEALRGINLTFRKNDFVSILGPSGCGKTTMLNIIGGLDRYTSGDLIINGISTKEYKDVDWDIYRNNSIGFVFQNYNLIPHQSVLSNVELAMTLAGISRDERKKRATQALEKVGLGDQINKKPTQMSGGQMQRVAIARALVNNPDILLADEPTGALDSETSLQIMEILKDVAKDRLVIMVTHNSSLAEKYSTRIVNLLDGQVTSDSNPYDAPEEKASKKKRKKISMSFMTALSLSFRNLLTKKTRTMLTAFAGSIGIIGIALILSLSSGMNNYIKNLERDTLSTYPIQIESQSVDMGAMMAVMMVNNNKDGINHDLDQVYANNIMNNIFTSMSNASTKNDLKHFKEYIQSEEGKRFEELTNSIKYGYKLDLHVFKSDTSDGILQINPSEVLDSMGMDYMYGGNSSSQNMGSTGMTMNFNIWDELLDNEELLKSQYDIIAGSWPSSYDEVVLIVDENNEISDYSLYSLGLLDSKDLEEIQKKLISGEKFQEKTDVAKFSYEEILKLKFKLVLNTDYYVKENNAWVDKRENTEYMKDLLEKSTEIKISGILRPNSNTTLMVNGNIGYTYALTEHVINSIGNTDIAKEQRENPEIDVITGVPFELDDYIENLSMNDVAEMISALPEEEQRAINGMLNSMTDEQIIEMMKSQLKENSDGMSTYESNCALLGIVDFDNPSSINLYPKGFDSKEEVNSLIKKYNNTQTELGKDEYVINYTDIVAAMTSSVSSVIDIVSYVLIAFVAISLVVSSIMIAIITYISVLERTKEIGVLRSIGASKRDISRVFNAETLIEGFVAGTLGILVTIILNIPINMIINSLVGISGIASLPLYGGISLIVISMLLTVIAGFIPSKMAAKKDPVEALRSE